MLFLRIFLPLLVIPFSADGLSFLFFLIGTNQFERHTFEFMAQEFARRAHKVTTVKPILVPEEPRLVKPLLHMVHEKVLKDVLPRRLFEPLGRVGQNVPWSEEAGEESALRAPYWAAHNYSCGKLLSSNLMEVIARADIDLAILHMGDPCLMGIVHALGIPFVLFDLEGVTDETLIASGAPWTLPELNFDGHAVDFVGALSARLTRSFSLISESFAQSGIPWLASLFSARFRSLDGHIDELFASDYEIQRKFRKKFPDVGKLRRMARLYLANTDTFLESPFSAFPNNLLPIGGVHIDSVRPLFAPWNLSMESSKRGVILCSFGTQADTGTMPKEFVHSLLDVFSRLADYRIFWRISPKLSLPGLSTAQFEGLSEQIPHLNITSFFPQNELLAHQRTRLLITNGGAHSLMESIHWGVPLLGIPLYGSNSRNLEKAKQRGIGIVLGKREATNAKTLLNAIRTVLNCPKIGRKAQEIGWAVRRRPSSAFDRVHYALETTARQRRPLGEMRGPQPPMARALFQCLHVDVSLALLLFVMAAAVLIARIGLKLAAFCYQLTLCVMFSLGKALRAISMRGGKGGGHKKDE
uniref:glucuronosyltransferase n=1 Tax=Globodera rostochiensis TaxID=31243 RepID=A0A914GX04_GLORO